MNFQQKYLKYKRKYLKLKKNQQGGEIPCDITTSKQTFRNIHGTCWMISIQTLLTSGHATANNLERVMKSFIPWWFRNNIDELKNKFITNQIQKVKSNPLLNNFFPTYIFRDDKIIYLKIILNKFIDRYYSKVFNIQNSEKPETLSDFENPERCELVISNNFKKLFDFDALKNLNSKSHGGSLIHMYLFANLLSIFFLEYKVSFTNYNNNFNEINFNNQNDIGITIETIDHSCCFFLCNEKEKYYNDNDRQFYNCNWKKLLKSISVNNLFVKRGSCIKQIDIESYQEDKQGLLKVINLVVVSKHKTDNELDTDMKNILNLTNLDSIKNLELLNNLGFMYFNGYGVPQNYSEAIKYFKLAADQGDPQSQTALGLIYDNEDGINQDYTLAVKYYEMAASQYFAQAQYNLAIMYEKEYGVVQDFALAERYYKLAADQEYVDAQYNLGMMYEDGKKIKQNYSKALHYYKLAASQGYSNAQYSLGRMNENGIGIRQDIREAMRYYQLAAKQGHIDAQYNLEILKLIQTN